MPTLPTSTRTPAHTRSTPLNTLGQRLERLAGLLGRLLPVPAAWAGASAGASKGGTGKSSSSGGGSSLPCEPCSSYRGLVTAWRKAMKWTDGLDHALAVMLASVASTKVIGDQLWIKVVSPASTGKSTLAEAISVNKDYTKAVSTLTGFHSGYQGDEGGEENYSLLSQINGKTLIVKDADPILQAPNRSQILSEARDIYDGVSRSSYRNKMSKDHEGLRVTVILCGTASIRALDSSELGERFLDCVIMEHIDDELEDEILWRVANRADRNTALESNGEARGRYEPELAEAMSLTGGYVAWLRENAVDVMSTITMPDWAKRKCARLGKFVSHMRARPSVHQEETAEREFSARLVSQLVRLAKCLALVLNYREVDEHVIRRVRRIAMDTGRGRTMAIASHLFGTGRVGMEPKTIALLTSDTEDKTRKLLRFLKQIGVTEIFTPETKKGIKGKPRWRLTARMQRLFAEVSEPTDEEDDA